MLHRALEQFLTDVHWGELDYLVVDMPPGTGDVAISLGQLLPEPDLVLVTTPQPAAQKVARRAGRGGGEDGHARGRRRREHELHLVCPCCGEIIRPFGEGGGQALADELGVPLLGQVPLDEPLRIAADEGTPLVISHPDAASSRAVADARRAAPGRAAAAAGRRAHPQAARRQLVAVVSRRRRITTGSIVLPDGSSRSSRFSISAHSCSDACPIRESRSVISAASSPSIGRNSSAGVLPNSRSWMPWMRPSSGTGSAWSSTRRSSRMSLLPP